MPETSDREDEDASDPVPATLGPGETGAAVLRARPEVRRRAAALVVGSIAAHVALALAPAPLDVLAVLVLWILAAAALTLREWRAAHVTILCALLTLPRMLPELRVWPANFLVPLVGYGLLALVLPRPPALRWLRRGNLDRATLALVAATIVVSAAALGAWYFGLHPDVSDLFGMIPSGASPIALVGMALAFASVNAAIEEAIWRGVLLGGPLACGLPPIAAVIVSALSFGAVHINGFPRGWVGVAMASVYAAALGWVRLRSGGMLAPWLAHVGADVAIFVLLLAATGRLG